MSPENSLKICHWLYSKSGTSLNTPYIFALPFNKIIIAHTHHYKISITIFLRHDLNCNNRTSTTLVVSNRLEIDVLLRYPMSQKYLCYKNRTANINGTFECLG